MFKKLVSNLAFSPALISEVGFYARRLRQEEVTRRFTLLFVALALTMQSLAVFSPPESANASSEQDIIRGGVSSLNDLLVQYDQNKEDIRDIYSAVGVTRSEILNTKPTVIRAKDSMYLMTRYGKISSDEREVSISYAKSSGGMGIRYFSPITEKNADPISFQGWVGYSTALGWFGIVKTNGGIVTDGIPTTINSDSTTGHGIVKTITALNLTHNEPISESSQFNSLDKVSYSLKITNSSAVSATASLDVRVSDILEYSTLIDGGGATFDQSSGALSWPQVQLSPGQSEQRTFAVQMNSSFASTARGSSNPTSYDCIAAISFGNTLETPISCPAPKVIESMFLQLPNIDVNGNIIFASVVIAFVGFFYIRTRQMKKEIQIIRHNFNTGVL